MKLTKTLSYNRQNLEFALQTWESIRQNHALVVMFQPFKGKWIQSLGCFLSRASVSGTILHQIMMEEIILSEKTGLKVDAIASDGAFVDPQRRL